MPEFRGAKPEDYEFREDGKVVRKDRWRNAIISICDIVGLSTRDFEIEDVVSAVSELVGDEWMSVRDIRLPGNRAFNVKMSDDSVLRNVSLTDLGMLQWQAHCFDTRNVAAWQELAQETASQS